MMHLYTAYIAQHSQVRIVHISGCLPINATISWKLNNYLIYNNRHYRPMEYILYTLVLPVTTDMFNVHVYYTPIPTDRYADVLIGPTEPIVGWSPPFNTHMHISCWLLLSLLLFVEWFAAYIQQCYKWNPSLEMRHAPYWNRAHGNLCIYMRCMRCSTATLIVWEWEEKCDAPCECNGWKKETWIPWMHINTELTNISNYTATSWWSAIVFVRASFIMII